LVWAKSRSTAWDHTLFDSVRGFGKSIKSNTTGAEATSSTSLTGFVSNGFTLGVNSDGPAINYLTGQTFVGWTWKANGAGVSNTAGTITSTVSANTSAGFSVVTYTGNGTGGATVGHGLGATPSMIIVKKRSGVADWPVQHISLGPNASLRLNGTDATANEPWWNSTAPSSTVFTLGNSNTINQSGETFVAYCFAPVAGYSAFGSYTGNGSTNGPFVFTGFRPAFVITKSSSAVSNWELEDYRRGYNGNISPLIPNDAGTEFSGDYVDLLSNGFKIRTSSTAWNSSGNTYIYMAFAENPFKFSNAR